MKPVPIPLFNYKKRERHALVSDPQQMSNKLSDITAQTQGSSGASMNISSMNDSNSRSLPDTNRINPTSSYPPSHSSAFRNNNNSNNNNYPGAKSLSSSWNNLNNKRPSSTSMSKPTLPKMPSLMNHKPGVSNRRIGNATGKDLNQQSGFVDFDNLNSNQSPALLSKSSMNEPAGRGSSSCRGRGRGGRQQGVRGGFNSQQSSRGRGHAGGMEHTKSGASMQRSHTHPSDTFSSFSSSRPPSSHDNYQNNSYSGHMSNTAQWRSSSDDYLGKKNAIVKLQSGQTQIQSTGARNVCQARPGVRNPAASATFQGGGNTGLDRMPTTTNNNRTTPYSIFDEEDVKMQPTCPKMKKGSKSGPMDRSLRVFTCPIQDMLSWKEAQVSDGPVLFEIYGLVMSVPTDSECGFGKEFYIRDQSANIQCIFYEIDRNLPSLTKGQVHRFVGSVEKSRGGQGMHLKVVSVRKADKEERQACLQATDISQLEMSRLANTMATEP